MNIKVFHCKKETGKIFEQNNESIALNVLFSSQDNEEMTLICKSEHS